MPAQSGAGAGARVHGKLCLGIKPPAGGGAGAGFHGKQCLGIHGKQCPEVEPPAGGGVVLESTASSALKLSPRWEEA